MKNFLITALLSITLLAVGAGPTSAGSALTVSDRERQIESVVARMPLEEKVGQMLMTTVSGRTLSPANQKVLNRCRPGGVILYKSNFVSVEQTIRLIEQIQDASRVPLLIAADQEGGRVVRIGFGTDLPSSMSLGAARSPENAYRCGLIAGKEMKALGINVNLAPMLDLNTRPGRSPVGTRSYGSDPLLASGLGTAYLNGLRETGVAAAVKHFPGNGDTDVDSHYALPVIPHDGNRLTAVELLPFQTALDSGVEMVMPAHAAYPALDSSRVAAPGGRGETFLPATASYKILTGLLRERMGFNGVIVTDALHMKSMVESCGAPPESAVTAIKAGADLVMVHTNLESVRNRILKAVNQGELTEERINQSVKRIIRLKLDRGIVEIAEGNFVPGAAAAGAYEEKTALAREVVGCEQHRAVVEEIARQSVTLVKNDHALLPFKLSQKRKIVIFAPGEESRRQMQQCVARLAADEGITGLTLSCFSYKNLPALNNQQKQAIRTADCILLGTCSFSAGEREPDKSARSRMASTIARYARTAEKPLAVLAIGDPMDIAYLPEAAAFLTVYGTENGPGVPAGVEAAFGHVNPAGRLPVDIWNADYTEVIYPYGHGLGY